MDSNNNKRPRFSSSPPLSLSYNKQDVITMDVITSTSSSGGLGGVTNTNTIVIDLEQKIKTMIQEVEVAKGEVQEKKKIVDEYLALQRAALLVPNSPPFTQQHQEALTAAQQAYDITQKLYDLAIQERNHAEQQLKELKQQLHPGTLELSEYKQANSHQN
jgi:hypothetical protein